MPLHWQIEGFALASSYDESTGRYVGLWIDGDKASPPVLSDATLLVKPDVAVAQREADGTETPAVASPAPDAAAEHFEPHPDHPGVYLKKGKTRFFGSKTLNPDRIALDFKNVSDELLAHLREEGTELTVRIDIEATRATGFDEAQVRTVSENANTLKFEQSGFEEM
jgi:hypothetical protein